MAQVIDTEVRHRQIALRSTFKTALRSVDNLKVIEFVINGKFVGEAVATPAITGDQFEEIVGDLKSVDLIGREISNAQEFSAELQQKKICNSAKAAIDMAIYSFLGSFGEKIRIQSDVTIPLSSFEDYPRLIAERIDFKAFKIKLDKNTLGDSISKISVVREVRPDVKIRIDPNQSWNVKESIQFVQKIEELRIPIDYLEQPTPRLDFDALRHIRQASSIPVMADESCFSERDLRKLIDLAAIDLVNLKILKNGGISEVCRLARIAEESGVRVSIGSMMEGDRGVHAAAFVASRIAPDYVHDLDAAWWCLNSSISYQNGFMVTQ